MFISCPGSAPVVRASSDSVTRQACGSGVPPARAPASGASVSVVRVSAAWVSGSMRSTRATISSRIQSSAMAPSGISTLCSVAIARARASTSAAAQRTR